MPKKSQRNAPSSSDSVRWPKLLANPEVAQSLVDHPGFALFEQEWQDQLQDLVYRLKHDRSKLHDDFYRGQIADLETNLGFRLDLEDWKKQR